ncbi:MAG: hypothetical protein A2Z14_00655 [Chloroflexi bacterium RBG_16_48_8]|nr:MAG: hypothetical protein A2Z14_00655 [Chloroflexi bacterium RBG_16_48_8]
MIEGSSKLDHILMNCIHAIQEKDWTIEDCLHHYPHLRQDLEPMLEAAIRLRNVRSLQPSLRFKRETINRMQLRLQASRRPPKFALYQRRALSEGTLPKARIQPKKQPALQWALPILVVAFTFIAMAGGFTFVANAASPGDVLYQLDQAIERVQIRLELSAEERTKLYLGFASERLDEAFELAEDGKSDQVINALQGYEENIHAAETILKENVAGKEGYQPLVVVLDETLEMQTKKLQELMAVAPATAQTSINAAMMMISNIRIAMAMPSPKATATSQAVETRISPEPSGTVKASATTSSKTTPIADGTPAASTTPIPATATSPTALATPTAISSRTSTPTYPPPTTQASPTPSHTPIPGPDLTVSTYQWIPSAPAGSLQYLDYIVRNIGTTTAQQGYLNQLYVDGIVLQNYDPEIGLREGRLLQAGETDIDYFLWIATCGVHELKIVIDEDDLIQESNESNNSTEEYTITVDCSTTSPP